MTPSQEKHFLSQDGGGHWYVVPVSHRQDWEDWRYGKRSYDDPPDWAELIEYSPELVEFIWENPL